MLTDYVNLEKLLHCYQLFQLSTQPRMIYTICQQKDRDLETLQNSYQM